MPDTGTRPLEAAETVVTPPSAATDRLTPGTIIAKRYRIAGLLGRGGMGAVYRADDLRLGQQVALKFLSSASVHPGELQRLYSEVRMGRKVTHPNVCRIYDLVEDGRTHFLSMELVEGEDLASLLRRIGRVPMEKAVEIARDICSGLQAIHDEGIVHRDLKPGNVMIDGRGNARLTDFGLATTTDTTDSSIAGTPAYMSPEQLAGEAISARSDVYALGLLLFELFSGTRVYPSSSLAALLDAHRGPKPRLATIVPGVDSSIDDVVAACLHEEGERRPATAREVLYRLPGGRNLLPGLNKSDTPQPDLVAAAQVVGDLRPGIAWALLAIVVAGMATSLYVSNATTLVGRGVPHPPSVLRDRALQIIDLAGQPRLPNEMMSFGPTLVTAYRYVERGEKRPTEILPFWFRQSPHPLTPFNFYSTGSLRDPPADYPGMASVVLDAEGSLLEFRAVPPDRPSAGRPLDAGSWSSLLKASSLRPDAARPVPFTWNAPLAHDQRWAWDVRTERGPVHVEAAALQGRRVWYRRIQPWEEPRGSDPFRQRPWQTYTFGVLLVLLSSVAIWIARRNLRAGRGDRRGAMNVALVVFALAFLERVITAEQVRASFALGWTFVMVGSAVFYAGLAWVAYVAMEPAIRRRWPEALISWNRAVMGRLRDPIVGRDVLVGASLAAVANIFSSLRHFVQPLATIDGQPLAAIGNFLEVTAPRRIVGALLSNLEFSVFIAFGSLLALWVCCVVFRSILVGSTVFMLCATLAANDSWFYWSDRPAYAAAGTLSIALIAAGQAWMLLRLGLLANLAFCCVFAPFEAWTLTLNSSMWYYWATPAAVLLTGSVALWSFRVSLGGRSPFAAPWAFD